MFLGFPLFQYPDVKVIVDLNTKMLVHLIYLIKKIKMILITTATLVVQLNLILFYSNYMSILHLITLIYIEVRSSSFLI